VTVALVMQQSKRMRHITFSSVTSLALRHYSTLFPKWYG